MPLYVLILLLLVVFGIGFTIGSIKKSVGTIRIDRSDPDGPYIFLELGIPVAKLETKKRALLRIRSENYISRN